MKQFNKKEYRVCVVGMGYVGLPLAARLSLKGFDLVGYDVNSARVKELKNINDRNNDINLESLKKLADNSILTSNVLDIKDCNIFIITVPTPINKYKTPNLEPIISASKMIGKIITKGSIVIFESTVYPGVTDEVCTPILEKESKLKLNKDFSTGYSPERIVPGDKINTIDKIKKVVSASNLEALKTISHIYSHITDAGIFKASSIKVAEASKVVENIQRDVNIALINELHQMFDLLGIDTNEVTEAASTKWNFMKLTPGLVGGHCISIDPYYLMHKSLMKGYSPHLMSTARKINDEMHQWVVSRFLKFIADNNLDLSSLNVTFFGYTFKENCNDIRNTKVKNLLEVFRNLGLNLSLWDPLLLEIDKSKLRNLGIKVYDVHPENVELAFVCVYHDEIIDFLNDYDGLIFDFRKLNITNSHKD
jgi:UDP-N-acetyl-D-galactosamine dehydrogenase